MIDEQKTKKIEDFPENAEPADTDYFLNATGNVMKKNKSVAADHVAEGEAGD